MKKIDNPHITYFHYLKNLKILAEQLYSVRWKLTEYKQNIKILGDHRNCFSCPENWKIFLSFSKKSKANPRLIKAHET